MNIIKLSTEVYLSFPYYLTCKDIKPGNILLSSTGYSKIADFGVSKETDQTLALTFIGTQTFLAPERLREGSPCTPASDVWALCLSMMEIAMAKFPFPIDAMGSAFDIMQFIVQEPSPTLPKSMFSSEFEDFCKACLLKDPKVRPHPQQLMVRIILFHFILNQPIFLGICIHQKSSFRKIRSQNLDWNPKTIKRKSRGR